MGLILILFSGAVGTLIDYGVLMICRRNRRGSPPKWKRVGGFADFDARKCLHGFFGWAERRPVIKFTAALACVTHAAIGETRVSHAQQAIECHGERRGAGESAGGERWHGQCIGIHTHQHAVEKLFHQSDDLLRITHPWAMTSAKDWPENDGLPGVDERGVE